MKFLSILVFIAAVSGCHMLGLAQEEESNDTTIMALALALANSGSAPACAMTSNTCITTVGTEAENANQTVCRPTAGMGRFYCLENVDASDASLGSSRYVYLGIGFAAGVTAAPAGTAGGNSFTVLMGKDETASNRLIATFNDNINTAPFPTTAGDADALADLLGGAKTFCFDLSSSSPPRYTLWVTGKNGANCASRSTLTSATKVYEKSDWGTAAAVTDNTVYVRRSGASGTRVGISRVYVDTQTAL